MYLNVCPPTAYSLQPNIFPTFLVFALVVPFVFDSCKNASNSREYFSALRMQVSVWLHEDVLCALVYFTEVDEVSGIAEVFVRLYLFYLFHLFPSFTV